MNTFIGMIISTVSTGIALGFAWAWSNTIDYSLSTSTYFPFALAWLLGIATLSLAGGTVGAYYDMKDEKKFS